MPTCLVLTRCSTSPRSLTASRKTSFVFQFEKVEIGYQCLEADVPDAVAWKGRRARVPDAVVSNQRLRRESRNGVA